jgi:hypothetical protein
MTGGRRYVVEGAEPHCTVVDLSQPDKTHSRHTTRQVAQAEADQLNSPRPRTPRVVQPALFGTQEGGR